MPHKPCLQIWDLQNCLQRGRFELESNKAGMALNTYYPLRKTFVPCRMNHESLQVLKAVAFAYTVLDTKIALKLGTKQNRITNAM